MLPILGILLLLLGFAVSIIANTLGIEGGIIFIPVFVLGLGLTAQEAAGVSLTTMNANCCGIQQVQVSSKSHVSSNSNSFEKINIVCHNICSPICQLSDTVPCSAMVWECSIKLLVGIVCCIFGNAAEIGVPYLL